MDGLLDTSIVIDLYRGYPPAAAWAQHNAVLRLGVASVVWMECVYGADNRHRQRQLIDLLSRFSIMLLTDDDQTWAMRQLAVYRLSNGVGVPNCLIAAPCYRLGLPLYTRNLKHFAPLLGGLVKQPY